MNQQHVAKLRVGKRDPHPGGLPNRDTHIVWAGDGTLLPEQGCYFRVSRTGSTSSATSPYARMPAGSDPAQRHRPWPPSATSSSLSPNASDTNRSRAENTSPNAEFKPSSPAESERDPGPRLRVFDIVKTLKIEKPAKSRKKLLRALSEYPNDLDLNIPTAFEYLREPKEKSTSTKYLRAAEHLVSDSCEAACLISLTRSIPATKLSATRTPRPPTASPGVRLAMPCGYCPASAPATS